MDEARSDEEVLAELETKATGPAVTTSPEVLSDSLSEQTADSQQRRKLREKMMKFILCLLAFEIVFLFWIIYMQGISHRDGRFVLNEWAFGFFTNGVLIQTFFSLRTIVTHLFPDGAKDFSK